MNYFRISKLVFIAAAVAFVFLFVSCTKNVAGPQGDPGTPGKPGNMKQSHVNTLNVTSTSWSFNANNYWESLIYVPEITSDIAEKGEVKLYLQANSQWQALPYASDFVFTQYSMEAGKIHLNYADIHGGTPARPADANYRIVIISAAQ